MLQINNSIRKLLYKKTDVVFCFFWGLSQFSYIYYIYISRVSLHTHQVCWDNLFLQEDGVQEHHPGQQSQIVLCPEEAQEDERVEEGEVVDNEGEEGEEDEEDKEKKGGGLSRRTRLPVYKKLLAIREADRFLEEGLKTGVEKR